MSTAGPRAAARRARPLGLALLPAATGLLVACGNVQVRPLATGAQDRPAYALAGPSLDGLREQARRLCPAGADVLRSAQRVDGGHAVQSTPASWYGNWWQKSQAALAPASADAQLVVLCQPVQGLSTLAALPPAPLTSSTAAAAESASASESRPSAGDRNAADAAPVGEVELRGGMTAALPTAAVSSGRPGRAPSAAAAPGQARHGTASGAARTSATGTETAATPARPASSPILTY